jgi:hypothetical protein
MSFYCDVCLSTVFQVPCFCFLFLVYFCPLSFRSCRFICSEQCIPQITFYVSLVPFLVLFVFFSLCFFTSFIHLLYHRSYLPYFFIVLKAPHHTVVWASGGTTPRILALWVRMGTGEKGELVWATAHYTSHPLTFPDFLCFCTPPFCITVSLTCFLLFFVRCCFHSPPRSSPYVFVLVFLHVPHVLCFSRYVPAVLFRMLLRSHRNLVAISLSQRVRFLSDKTHTWLTHFVHVSRCPAARCVNDNSYRNIAQ